MFYILVLQNKTQYTQKCKDFALFGNSSSKCTPSLFFQNYIPVKSQTELT